MRREVAARNYQNLAHWLNSEKRGLSILANVKVRVANDLYRIRYGNRLITSGLSVARYGKLLPRPAQVIVSSEKLLVVGDSATCVPALAAVLTWP